MKAIAISPFVLMLALIVNGQEPSLVITNATVIDPRSGDPLPERSIVVTGSRIAAVDAASDARVPQGATVIDGTGRFVMPGLIDTHIHLGFGTDQQTRRSLDVLVAHGITSIRDAGTGGQEQRLLALKAAAERGDGLSPRIYVSGMISVRSIARYKPENTAALARQMLAWGVDGLKIRDGLTFDDVQAVLREAQARGAPVFGHTYDGRYLTRDEIYAQEAIEAGVKGVMHVAGIPLVKPEDRPAPPTTARFGPDSWTDWWLYYTKLWLRADAGLEQRLIETMVKQRAWLEPTLITEDWIANADSYRDTWANRGLPGTFEQTHEGSPLYSGRSLEEFRAAFDRMKDFVRRFRRAGGVVITGTDCILGCGYGIADELRLLVDSGLSPVEALRAATSDAASVLGWGDRVGRVEAGAAADLLVLDEDPLRDVRNVTTLRALVINGRHLDRSQLDALRASPRSRGQE